ncbi:Fe(3+) dicitrate ABC transporter substrate-binding protein [Vibrio salinus]|uniref:Fe(3+) dicitrate ABC transporter substrate-binding protein n=1 Tax=Vibrio salinus TaxID=2899784 RepID=UPI001E46592B|nr:Fe(3+) dicitrate ABC transporter substrate-binding protein [Vibrio salinus]MCE0496116.1 ABC transporter substrate-binding protein [Vibrio salinus]
MRKTLGFFFCFVLLFCGEVAVAKAVTVVDSHGRFSIDYQPERIVALEFSFVDALVSVGLSPVGIADDNDPGRLLPEIKEKLSHWQSVGTRSQPSLEVIASLKPDLIIADVDRHSGIYSDLNKIAPTLLLPSRRETYQSNLKSAEIIGKAVGRGNEIEQRLRQHNKAMNHYKLLFKKAGLAHKFVQFGVARENGFYAHSEDSYAGGVLHTLGFEGAAALHNEKASRQISFEQLLAINPDYLVVGDYVSDSIIKKWEKQSLWRVLKAVQSHHIYHVNGNLWSRCRGIMAAEAMANDLMQLASGRNS